MHSAKASAAVHWCWVTAHLYEQQTFIGVFKVTHACCDCFAEQHWTLGNVFCKASAAEHWCWVTAHLYEQQIFTGVFTVRQACCESVLRSTLDSGECILPKPVLQCCSAKQSHSMHVSM